MDFIIAIVNGLSLGGTYAMIAIGYTMVYGIAKMLNFAHGDIIMVGGYAMYITLLLMDLPIVALLFAIIFCVVLGVCIERFAYKPLRGASPLAVLITAIGVSYLRIAYSTILTLALTVVIMTALTVFVKYSKPGRAMIAVSEDRDAARLMGINTNAIIAITFAIGSALAAVAGYCMLIKSPSLSNTLGAMPGIKAFTAAVIGGIGSIPGAMLGGILLGVIESISLGIPTLAPFTDAVEFSILIVILLVKPAGLLGKARREKV